MSNHRLALGPLLCSMGGTAAQSGAETAGASGNDSDLTERALAGDSGAFATLYDRYEGRIYNFCYRLTASRDDAADATQETFLSVLRKSPKLRKEGIKNFPAYLHTVARNASYDLMRKKKRSTPTEEIETVAQFAGGSGGGGVGSPQDDPERDPERSTLIQTQQEEVRAANAQLPERQREVLALREVEEFSYQEIAEMIGTNVNSVSQLISRARLNLRANMRGSALAAITTRDAECERALPLIAMREDGQLPAGDDRSWLEQHLAGCETCRISQEAMQEAGTSYRGWVPLVPLATLREETLAKAAELIGPGQSTVATLQIRVAKLFTRRTVTAAGVLLAAAAGGVLLATSLDDGNRQLRPGEIVAAKSDEVTSVDQRGKVVIVTTTPEGETITLDADSAPKQGSKQSKDGSVRKLGKNSSGNSKKNTSSGGSQPASSNGSAAPQTTASGQPTTGTITTTTTPTTTTTTPTTTTTTTPTTTTTKTTGGVLTAPVRTTTSTSCTEGSGRVC